MEETGKQEVKNKPCCCKALLGALVILFAWWNVSWAAIALTVLGVLVILKEFVSCCCCKGKTCK
jgi:hypothetical protein